MSIETFIGILLFSCLSAFSSILVMKNRSLRRKIAKNANSETNLGLVQSHLDGINQKDFNNLIDEVMDSSDEFLLIFDKNMQLKRWNKTAAQVATFDKDMRLETMVDLLKVDSRSILKKMNSQISSSPRVVEEEVELHWKDGKRLQHKYLPVLADDNSLSAFAITGVLTKVENSENELSAEQVINTIGTPVGQLKILNKQLGGFLKEEVLNKDQLQIIEKKQGSLIDSAKGILDYYKTSGAKVNLSEDNLSLSMNALVRSLSLLIENTEFPISMKLDKNLQGSDARILMQPSNFQRNCLKLIHYILAVSNSPRSTCNLKLNWTPGPMETVLSMNFSMEKLGQDLGTLWMNNVINNRKDFVDYQSSFAGLSCTLENFRKESEVLVVELVLPRDLSES